MDNEPYPHISQQETADDLKRRIAKSLPEKGSMLTKAINLCLDQIRQGNDTDHYKEVLLKLSQINKR